MGKKCIILGLFTVRSATFRDDIICHEFLIGIFPVKSDRTLVPGLMTEYPHAMDGTCLYIMYSLSIPTVSYIISC